MNSLITSLRCVTPIFLMILAGCYCKFRNHIPEKGYTYITTLCFKILLPMQLFCNVYKADFRQSFSPPLIIFLSAQMLVAFFAAQAITKIARINARERGVWLQTSYRGNLAVIAMALVSATADTNAIASMTIAVTIIGTGYNILAVIALDSICNSQSVSYRKLLLGVVKNPLIIGMAAGFLFQILPIAVPAPILSAFTSIGAACTPMALLALGASMRFSSFRLNIRKILLGSSIRLLVVPLLSVLIALWVGFRGSELLIILASTGSPLATTAYSMAQVYKSDDQLTGQLVFSTSLFCSFSMFVFIFILSSLSLI